MGPEKPSGCGAINMSKKNPRSCRSASTGNGRCIRFQCGNTGCKAANHLFNIRYFRIIRATVWESVWTQFSNLGTLCMGSGNFAICTNISLIFSSIVLAGYPVPSRSGRELLGESIFEEEAGNGETGTSVPSLARAMRKEGKLQNWIVDNWTGQNQKRS